MHLKIFAHRTVVTCSLITSCLVLVYVISSTQFITIDFPIKVSGDNSSQMEEDATCHKEIKGWPPDKVTNNLRPFLKPNQKTALVSPSLNTNKNTSNSPLLVICKSRVDAFEQRDIVRQTWMAIAKENNVSAMFVVGIPEHHSSDKSEKIISKVLDESKIHGDILQEDFVDTYQNLTLKVMFSLKFINDNIENLPEWVLVVDDDSYVNVPYVLKYAKSSRSSTKLISGKTLGKNLPVLRPNCSDTTSKFTSDKWSIPTYMYKRDHFPNSASGIGYFMPLRVVPCLYHKGLDTQYIFLDDVFVTGLLRVKCRLSLRDNDRIKFMGQDICKVDTKSDLVIHNVKGAKAMTEMHLLFTGKATCISKDGSNEMILITELV